jgi:hypothetical protein
MAADWRGCAMLIEQFDEIAHGIGDALFSLAQLPAALREPPHRFVEFVIKHSFLGLAMFIRRRAGKRFLNRDASLTDRCSPLLIALFKRRSWPPA